MYGIESKISRTLFNLLLNNMLQVCGDPNLRKVGAMLAC